jgi:hypothetical protein
LIKYKIKLPLIWNFRQNCSEIPKRPIITS